jgi:hypothetical protein
LADVRLLGDLEHLEIARDFSGSQVDAHGEELQAVLRGGGHPDLIAPHHRR